VGLTHRIVAVSSVLLPLCAVATALAAGPPVPRSEQLQMKSLLGQIGARDLAIVPTRLPAHFGFESFSVTASPIGLDVSLTDRRLRGDVTKARTYEISFDDAYFTEPLKACASKASRTLRVNGTRVFSDGSSVWRCIRTPRGRLARISAHGRLPAKGLAVLVASARAVT
jgi:hypothetical protein